MTPFQIFQVCMLALIFLTGAAIVLAPRPKWQIIIAAIFVVTQAVLFCTISSSRVVLSEVAVGIVALPSLVLVTLGRIEKTK